MGSFRIGIAAPDIVCICVDSREEGDIQGRAYSCYQKEAVVFEDAFQLIRMIDSLMEWLDYPQASVVNRSFVQKNEPVTQYTGPKAMPEKVVDNEKVAEHSGKLETFLIHVQYRQNATWPQCAGVPETNRIRLKREMEPVNTKVLKNALNSFIIVENSENIGFLGIKRCLEHFFVQKYRDERDNERVDLLQ